MDMQHQLGDIINQRYHITDTLGEGAIGITYKARDAVSGVDVAVKSLSLRHSNDWKAIELFEREAKVLANLHHPGIPEYLDYFQVDSPSDRHFHIVQQIAPGESLATLVAQGWHPTELEVRDIAAQMLRILIYLQSLHPPVIHRDIKPQNIIRHPDGQIFLVDFGTIRDTYRQTLTGGSTIIGTYGYMAPEQLLGQAEPATDLYGLGTTLLFLLTHRHPADLPQKRLKIDFSSAADISADFASWLDRMLEPAPEDRFTTATESLAVLQGKRDIIYPPEPSSRPPAGSKIVFQRTADSLFVDIPPFGWLNSDCLLLGACFPLCLFMAVGVGSMSGGWFSILGAISFLVLSFYIIWVILLVGFSRQVIEIEGKNVKITLTNVKFNSARLKLNSSYTLNADNIEKISLIEIKNQPNSPVKIIFPVFVQGINKYYFGQHIKHLEEKEWLVKELADFLNKPYNIRDYLSS